MAWHEWPGMGQRVWIPDDIPVEVKIIPRTGNWWRGGRSTAQTSTTWHDTGNPNTNADAEYRWAAGGRQGGSAGGYNGIFDDRKIIITQPFDEVVGHAANATGNATSWAFEQAWGGSVNWQRSLEVGYALHGGIIAAKGWPVNAKTLVQHNFWSGKHCPGQIRNRGLWGQVVAGVAAAAEVARRAAVPPTPSPAPTPEPTPVPDLNLPAFLFGTVKGFKFDPKGPVSNLWLKTGAETGRWPRLIDVDTSTPTRLFFFSDGSVVVAEPGKPVRWLSELAA